MARIEIEHGSYLLENVELLPYPNPAIAEFLLGDRLKAVVAEYTARVMTTYISRVEGRKKYKSGNELENSVRGDIFLGGFRTDRWVGQVVSTVEYAAADELGRTAYAPYEGHHDLRDSLYGVLGHQI